MAILVLLINLFSDNFVEEIFAPLLKILHIFPQQRTINCDRVFLNYLYFVGE